MLFLASIASRITGRFDRCPNGVVSSFNYSGAGTSRSALPNYRVIVNARKTAHACLESGCTAVLDLDPGRMPFIGIIRRILFLRYDPFEVDPAGFMK